MELGTAITKIKASKKPTGVKRVTIANVSPELYPPAYKKYFGDMDDVAPGELELDLNGKIFKKYLQITGYKFLTNDWDDAMKEAIPKQIGSTVLRLADGNLIKFVEVIPGRPSVLPSEAIRTDTTYDILFSIKTSVESNGKKIEEITIPPPFRMPLMLGSFRCWTQVAKSPKQLEAMGISPADPLGYFIIKGKKKFIRLYQYLLQNEILVYRGPGLTVIKGGQAKIKLQARLTYETSVRSLVTYIEVGKKGNIKCYFPFFEKKTKTNKTTNTEEIKGNVMMPIFSFIRIFHRLFADNGEDYLGSDTYINFITRMVPEERRDAVAQILQPSLIYVFGSPEENQEAGIADDLKYYKDKAKSNATTETLINFFYINIEHGFFPFIKQEGDVLGKKTNAMAQRFDLFCLMIARLCEVKAGLRAENDRDSWTNSKAVTPGDRINKLFRGLWYKTIQGIQTEIEKHNITDPRQALNYLADNKITQAIVSCFSTGNWSIDDRSNKTDISAPLKSDHPILMAAELIRIKAKVNDKSKNMKHRESRPDQSGFIDMNQTPESGECGLVKNLSKGTIFSRARSEVKIRYYLADYIESEADENHNYLVLLNSKPLGWANQKVFSLLKNYKVTGRIEFDTGIIMESNLIHIHNDSSRLLRPLLLVDPDGRLVIEKLATQIPDIWERDFDFLRTSGAVEFIDPREQEYTVIATRMDDIIFRDDMKREAEKSLKMTEEKLAKINVDPELAELARFEDLDIVSDTMEQYKAQLELNFLLAKRALRNASKSRKYTHCELNPRSVMSLSVSLIPFANHSPAVRIAYGAKHEEQATGALISNHPDEFEASMKLLSYPKRSLIETEINQMLGIEDAPRGSTVLLAVMPEFGWNQEDSYLMNQDLVDLGVFDTFKFTYIEHVLDEKAEEEYKIPEIKAKEGKNPYHALEPDGIPRVGSKLLPGDCILGIIRKERKNEIKIDVSEYMGPEDTAIVDTVIISNAGTLVKVKLREFRRPKVGDKFSTAPGQKGVISQIFAAEDMPIIYGGPMDGKIIDVCMNPLSYPTRMTVGLSMETLAGYFTTIVGKRLNGSAFQDFDINLWRRTLFDYGFKPSGTHTVMLGATGRLIQAQIFAGPTYMRRLKHDVDDKFQNRSVGKIDPITGQPLKGRKRIGGAAIKLGEMERDCLIGLGSSSFANERLFTSSDKGEVILCNNCKTIVNVNLETGIHCQICKGQDFRKINIPVVYRRWIYTLGSANIVFFHETKHI